MTSKAAPRSKCVNLVTLATKDWLRVHRKRKEDGEE